jgi:hypothetical protein
MVLGIGERTRQVDSGAAPGDPRPNDPRVPISETEQMVSRLKSLCRTMEFLRLDYEGHQIAELASSTRIRGRGLPEVSPDGRRRRFRSGFV